MQDGVHVQLGSDEYQVRHFEWEASEFGPGVCRKLRAQDAYLRVFIEEAGSGNMEQVLQYISEETKPYDLGSSNCKHFARDVFQRFNASNKLWDGWK